MRVRSHPEHWFPANIQLGAVDASVLDWARSLCGIRPYEPIHQVQPKAVFQGQRQALVVLLSFKIG